jgi:D-glycero-D-manno-heptose 1,7-bisphosphate phosphatase
MKIVILDRDGVINQDSKDYIKTPAEWIPVGGSIQAIADLCAAGFKVVVATNQSGLARKLPKTNKMRRKRRGSNSRHFLLPSFT